MDTLRFMYSRHDDSCTETNCKQFSHGYTRDTTHILSCASETVCTYTYDFNSFYTDARDTASCLKKTQHDICTYMCDRSAVCKADKI